ncbi:MAG: metal-dependent hydrolase [Sulfitobacter sp.]
MFIAHLPTGYLLGHSLRSVFDRSARIALVVGSILPDFDLMRFYFFDAQMIHHHTYLSHRPIIWAAMLLLGLLLSKKCAAGAMLTAFGLGGLLHMALDSIAGAIDWGWPLFSFAAPLIVVPATHDNWILSFLLHWTFAMELVLCTAAYVVWSNARKQKTPANDRGSSIS